MGVATGEGGRAAGRPGARAGVAGTAADRRGVRAAQAGCAADRDRPRHGPEKLPRVRPAHAAARAARHRPRADRLLDFPRRVPLGAAAPVGERQSGAADRARPRARVPGGADGGRRLGGDPLHLRFDRSAQGRVLRARDVRGAGATGGHDVRDRTRRGRSRGAAGLRALQSRARHDDRRAAARSVASGGGRSGAPRAGDPAEPRDQQLRFAGDLDQGDPLLHRARHRPAQRAAYPDGGRTGAAGALRGDAAGVPRRAASLPLRCDRGAAGEQHRSSGGRWSVGGWRCGDRKPETGGRWPVAGGRWPRTGDWEQETGNGGRDGRCHAWFLLHRPSPIAHRRRHGGGDVARPRHLRGPAGARDDSEGDRDRRRPDCHAGRGGAARW